MSLGLLLLFITMSSVNLSLGFFLGRMFHGIKAPGEYREGAAESQPAASLASPENPHSDKGHH